MPDAVKIYIATKDIREVDKVQRDIVALYKEDFSQYESEDKKLKLISIYDIIPAELNKQLEALAKKEHCRYADIGDALSDASPEVKTFHLLERFIRNKFTFNDVANLLYA